MTLRSCPMSIVSSWSPDMAVDPDAYRPSLAPANNNHNTTAVTPTCSWTLTHTDPVWPLQTTITTLLQSPQHGVDPDIYRPSLAPANNNHNTTAVTPAWTLTHTDPVWPLQTTITTLLQSPQHGVDPDTYRPSLAPANNNHNTTAVTPTCSWTVTHTDPVWPLQTTITTLLQSPQHGS